MDFIGAAYLCYWVVADATELASSSPLPAISPKDCFVILIIFCVLLSFYRDLYVTFILCKGLPVNLPMYLFL